MSTSTREVIPLDGNRCILLRSRQGCARSKRAFLVAPSDAHFFVALRLPTQQPRDASGAFLVAPSDAHFASGASTPGLRRRACASRAWREHGPGRRVKQAPPRTQIGLPRHRALWPGIEPRNPRDARGRNLPASFAGPPAAAKSNRSRAAGRPCRERSTGSQAVMPPCAWI